ncbi:MAG: hypothetical protein J6N54_01015 [Bacteroidales bacterium]|nr:hypothetical protein [Bacteroidales bacterium]
MLIVLGVINNHSISPSHSATTSKYDGSGYVYKGDLVYVRSASDSIPKSVSEEVKEKSL